MKLFAGCLVITLLYLGALLVNNLKHKIEDHEDIIESDDL